ncbi:MAG: IPT/TIG domain-containing protein, partial [Acidimicrobiales bacterium]
MTGNRRGELTVGVRCAAAVAMFVGLMGAGIATGGRAGASAPVQQVSSDTLTNAPTVPSGIHHATELETDTLAEGSTVVSSFQVGRFAAYGASAIGWATSTDGGQTWQHGLLPGVSAASPNPDNGFVSVANQSVLYDAALATWLIPTVGVVNCSLQVPTSNSCVGHVATEHTLLVNHSADGITWSSPVTAVASNVDKPWGVCDNSPTSPYYGTCYVAYAQIDDGDRLALVRSTDGGQTWSAPVDTTSDQDAYNAIPVVQPDGRLVIVATDVQGNGGNSSQLLSFVSTDGGATLSDAATGAGALPIIDYHTPAGGIRAKNKPSVGVDAAGTIYVAWSDCRFRTTCAENDIVVATSSDGVNYSAPIRVAADPTSSTVDHFIPGLGVRPGTSGSSAELGVVYYSYPNTNCTAATCRLNVEFSSSVDGGAQWSTSQLNPTSMQVGWLAPTSLGPAVGDYESVSYSQGHAVTVFPLASAPVSGTYSEAENAVDLPPANGTPITSSAGSGQTVPVGDPFEVPLQATVVNPTTGSPVAGATVTFTAPGTGAGGTFAGGSTSSTVTTNASGVATSPTLTANSTPGTYTISATTSGGSAGFMLTNAGAPSSVTPVTGSTPQGAPVDTPYPNPLEVTVRDANGAPVSGTPVVFTAPTTGSSGSFASPGTGGTASVTTNSAGVAQAPHFTADSTPGPFVVNATAGTASASFTMSNASSAPAALVVTGGNLQSTPVGQPFPSPLTIELVDSAGQPYPGAPVTFSAPSARASATFASSGTTTTTVVTNASGTATVPTVYAASGAGSYSVAVQSGAATASIALTNDAGPPAVVNLFAASNDQSQTIGSTFVHPLKVTVLDGLDNPIGNEAVTFTAPAAGPGGTFVGGGTSVVATTNSSGTATAPAFTANSSPGSFHVVVSAAAPGGTSPSNSFALTNTQPPSITSPNGVSFDPGVPGTFTVTSVGTPVPSLAEVGTLPAGVSFVDNGNGSATLGGTPTGSGVFPIAITASNGVGTPAQQSFVLTVVAAPAVTGVGPASGPTAGGTTVTVTGSGFTGATSVSFGTGGTGPGGRWRRRHGHRHRRHLDDVPRRRLHLGRRPRRHRGRPGQRPDRRGNHGHRDRLRLHRGHLGQLRHG